MDHLRILRRAWDITRFYRALWVFGILVALTTARSNGSSGNSGYQFNSGDFTRPNQFPPFNLPHIQPPANIINAVLGIGVALICVILILVIVSSVIRYVSSTALIRMGNRYEDSGEKVSVGTGFRLGWSRGAFRTWLIDFLIGLGMLLLFLLMVLIAASPLLLWLTHNETAGIIGTVIAVGLAILFILSLVILAAVISLVVQIARRVVILEGLGTIEGLRRGWAMVRRRLGDVIIMGLILFGLGIVLAIAMIPVVILLLLAGVVIAGLPALLAGGLTNIFVHGHTPQIVALIVGLPLLLAVLILPLTVIGGLVEVFTANVWTLTYRELLALETVAPAAPEPEAAL